METATVRRYSLFTWSPRVRWYGVVVSVGLLYLLVGRVSSDNLTWVQIHLPMSAASLVLVALAGVEACFLVRQWQDRHSALTMLRVQEQESALRITTQRLECINELAAHVAGDNSAAALAKVVPQKLAALFESDVTGVWTLDDHLPGAFDLRGIDGLNDTRRQAFGVLTKCTPCFEKVARSTQPVSVGNFTRDTAPSLAAFCGEEKLTNAVFSPVWVDGRLEALIGLFYKQAPSITSVYLGELQTVTRLLAAERRHVALQREHAQLKRLLGVTRSP